MLKILLLSCVVILSLCGCARQPEKPQKYAEAAQMVCPEQTRRVEITNSAYPEFYCVGMDGRVGTWLEYDANGHLRKRADYKADKLNGKWAAYHNEGGIETEGTMADGMREGEWTQYYVNGKPRSIKHYKNNQIHGAVKLYYQTGGLMAEGDYVEGYEEGPWKVYLEDGRLSRECRLDHGEEKHCNIYIKQDAESRAYHSKERGPL